jgi:Rod binding domain-containing protein
MSQGLPPIDQSLIPAAVRSQGEDAVKKYETALSFEGLLDQQLAQALTQTLQDTTSSSGDDGEGGGSFDDGSSTLMLQMLPQALSDGLVSQGGLGLAQQLYDQMNGKLGS